MEQNFSLIYKTSFKNNSFLKLQDFCIEFMSKEPEKIFYSIDFNSLSENCLISLIQHDNIKMNVIQVWEYVLKWGIAQNPKLSSDPSKYSKDDFITLKNTLQRCIPLINFFNLPSKEYMDKVYPYKKILPKDLRENLFKYFMGQPSNNQSNLSKKFDSVAISTLNLFINASEKNHVLAQYFVGKCYKHGYGTIKNKRLSFKYYEKAANKNYSKAQFVIGNSYRNGIGIEEDFKKAFYWYEKAAKNGSISALFNLGSCYRNGIGVEKDYNKAFELYKQSAEREDSDGMMMLGFCYDEGIGTNINKQKAFELYQNAANFDHRMAQYNLALMYEKGNGIIKDIDKAIYWYEKCARKGDKAAQYKLKKTSK
ncbi:hypothetical protein RclHR1_13320005 [Rhizophagus clarus]|uniref:BACK domain-containing protein n=1 Tax=Rhizophagus clarus TaxID=94130 RepID=A0A2Z6QQ66_9GLOM|nr:hypothetical protein RclHR1_13320005 [Rhizophagus clarus]